MRCIDGPKRLGAYLESLLDAEYERYVSNQKHYESVILLSGRQGSTQFQSFGNERFDSYWKSRGKDEEAANGVLCTKASARVLPTRTYLSCLWRSSLTLLSDDDDDDSNGLD